MRFAATILAVLVPGVASAHPDHLSGGEFGITHLLTDPFHLALSAAAVVTFLAARRIALRRSRRLASSE